LGLKSVRDDYYLTNTNISGNNRFIIKCFEFIESTIEQNIHFIHKQINRSVGEVLVDKSINVLSPGHRRHGSQLCDTQKRSRVAEPHGLKVVL